MADPGQQRETSRSRQDSVKAECHLFLLSIFRLMLDSALVIFHTTVLKCD